MKKRWPKLVLWNRGSWIRMSILAAVLSGALVYMIAMPGKSYHGPVQPLTKHEIRLRDGLRRDVEKLAGEIGQRHMLVYQNLVSSANFLEASFTAGGYKVERQGYQVGGKEVYNIEVEVKGADRAKEIVLIGAHYDSPEGSRGANDNATGTAAVLALSRTFSGLKPSRTVRFVAFVNEEPPHYHTPDMGSRVYARRSAERGEKIVAMMSLETLGYFSDKEGSQQYPFPLSLFYPSKGNFVAFVGNIASRGLVREVIGSFRRHSRFPSEGAALWGGIAGVGWSDHWSFWEENYPAIMVTDTALFRNPYWHTSEDRPDKVHYDHLVRVVAGLEKVVAELAGVSLPHPSIPGSFSGPEWEKEENRK